MTVFEAHLHVPITTSIHTLGTMTDEQQEALDGLVKDWRASRVSAFAGSQGLPDDYVHVTFITPDSKMICCGIAPDGRVSM